MAAFDLASFRRTFVFAAAFSAGMFLSLAPRAESTDMRWEVLADSERAIIDRLAADFYEASMRQSQSSAIESRTSELYQQATPAERARFRAERRSRWESMTDTQRDALRNAKTPSYRNLTEAQKAPFRSIALDKLGAAGALDPDAIAYALRNDI